MSKTCSDLTQKLLTLSNVSQSVTDRELILTSKADTDLAQKLLMS